MSDFDKEVLFLKALANKAKPAKLRIGMSTWEIIAQFGRPDIAEAKQMKTKKVETYKYQKIGRGYALKITIENNFVVGWDDRRQN